MQPTALATVQPTTHALERANLTREQVELLKRTIAKGTTDDEFALFVATANRMRLDPFAKQIFAVKRWDSKEKREVMAIQVSIDGYRASAHRTGEMDGEDGPYWCGKDGVWKEAWLDSEPPVAAKVLVYRKGISRPFVGIASYRSYVQRNREGNPNAMWDRGSDFMLAKCAEALGLRKAFPAELGGTVTPEEVGNDNEADAKPTFAPIAAPASSGPASTAPAAAAPASTPQPAAAPAQPPKPHLTEDQVVEIITAFGKCMTKPELKKVAHANAPASDDPNRERLLKAYEEQWSMIDDAEKTDRGGAQ